MAAKIRRLQPPVEPRTESCTAAGGARHYSLRGLQLYGLLDGDALGSQESDSLHLVGGKHGTGFSQPEQVDRIPENEIPQPVQRFPRPREVISPVRQKLWRPRGKDLHRAQCG